MESKSYRKDKLPELLAHLAAEFIEKESNRTSLITVTGASLSPSGKKVKILFTVLPDSSENQVLEFLNRKKGEYVEFVDKNAKIGFMPIIEFAIDIGEKNRQRIDEISNS